MLLMLMFIFYLTITFSNYPSEILFSWFSKLEECFLTFFENIHAPLWVSSLLIGGIYKTLSWVVAVMFTILEDLGVLPRIAFNLDKGFQKCCACGKQALCMMMGFGCNAAGVIGTRIIDSKRERLIAILTNNLVPCNGRFPTIIFLSIIYFKFSDYYININDFFSFLSIIKNTIKRNAIIIYFRITTIS